MLVGRYLLRSGSTSGSGAWQLRRTTFASGGGQMRAATIATYADAPVEEGTEGVSSIAGNVQRNAADPTDDTAAHLALALTAGMAASALMHYVEDGPEHVAGAHLVTQCTRKT